MIIINLWWLHLREASIILVLLVLYCLTLVWNVLLKYLCWRRSVERLTSQSELLGISATLMFEFSLIINENLNICSCNWLLLWLGLLHLLIIVSEYTSSHLLGNDILDDLWINLASKHSRQDLLSLWKVLLNLRIKWCCRNLSSIRINLLKRVYFLFIPTVNSNRDCWWLVEVLANFIIKWAEVKELAQCFED